MTTPMLPTHTVSTLAIDGIEYAIGYDGGLVVGEWEVLDASGSVTFSTPFRRLAEVAACGNSIRYNPEANHA